MTDTALFETREEIMSDHQYNATIISGYEMLLAQARVTKFSLTPKEYNSIIDLVADYRKWVITMTGTNDISPVPEKI
ncbi:hypothetical protein AGMMS49975_03300 [Clostridia bacterium]|nr:hypothetical protein AGMMS49975_03300 [Clostridia bacterium]GHU75363.1 hypothetical protein FACS1894188_06050 [Clostridia bacterium]